MQTLGPTSIIRLMLWASLTTLDLLIATAMPFIFDPLLLIAALISPALAGDKWLLCLEGASVRPAPSLPRAFVRASSAAENSPSSKSYRRAQTARPDIAELSSPIGAQGRSVGGRTGKRKGPGLARGAL